MSARLLNDDNDRNSVGRRYILLSSSDVSFFPRRSSRSSYRGAGLDPVDGSIYKPLTRVQITHAALFFLSLLPLTERLNAGRIRLGVGNDLHNDCVSGVSSRDTPQYNNAQLTRKVRAKISQGLCTS